MVFQTLFSMLFTFSDAFALQAIVKFGVEPLVEMEELVTVTTMLFLGFLTVSLSLLLIFRTLVASLLNNSALGDLLPWLAFFAFFTIPRVVVVKILQTNFQMKKIFFVDFANFGVAGILLGVLLVKGSIHVALDVVHITVFTGLLSSIVATILVRPHLKFRMRYSRAMLARISNFVRYQVAMGVTTTAQQNIDTLLVSGFTGATGAAIYGSAKMLFRAYDIVRETMSLFVFPAASKYHSRNDYLTLRTILEKSVSFLYLILIPGGIVLAFGAPLIFHLLYATKYDASIPIFRVLLLATLLFPIQMVFAVAMSGMGKIKELFRMMLIGFVVNVALATVLLATIGIVGAAIAFVVANGVQAILFFFYVRREVGVGFSQLLVRGSYDAVRFLREHLSRWFPWRS